MRIGKQTASKNIVFSLEKFSPSSSSSQGSSSSSSSSFPCGSFNSSITTVLGANLDSPDQYFAVALGMAVSTIGASGTLYYNNLSSSGPAIVTDISIDSVIVATISISVSYAGNSMAFEYMGNIYCGTFLDATLEF